MPRRKLGCLAQLWRYPVKSMRGEQIAKADLRLGGITGDRVYAFKDARAHPGFPWLTGRELSELLLYQAHFNEEAGSDAQAGAAAHPGAQVVVTSPSGVQREVADDELQSELAAMLGAPASVSLARSDAALADVMPLSMISMQTIASLQFAYGKRLDPRRFRANLYVDWEGGGDYPEDDRVGAHLRLGDDVVIEITERDPRCAMVCIDPESAHVEPGVLRTIASLRGAQAGVYARVIQPGTVHAGDPVYRVL